MKKTLSFLMIFLLLVSTVAAGLVQNKPLQQTPQLPFGTNGPSGQFMQMGDLQMCYLGFSDGAVADLTDALADYFGFVPEELRFMKLDSDNMDDQMEWFNGESWQYINLDNGNSGDKTSEYTNMFGFLPLQVVPVKKQSGAERYYVQDSYGEWQYYYNGGMHNVDFNLGFNPYTIEAVSYGSNDLDHLYLVLDEDYLWRLYDVSWNDVYPDHEDLTQIFTNIFCGSNPMKIFSFNLLNGVEDDGLISLNGFVYEFETQNNPPNTPSNPNPADGATNVDINADLSWTGGDPDNGDTVTYDVYFGTNPNPTTKKCSDISTTTCDVGEMNYNTHYYWKVVATDNHDESTTGAVWDFTTGNEPNNPPYTPSNPNPADGANDVDINADLSWTGGDPDAGDTVTYDVYFGTSANPTTLVCDDVNVESCDIATMNYNTHYYWKVVATDNHDASTEGPIWDFITGNQPNDPPYEPGSPNPADGATGVSVSLSSVSWTGGDPNGDDVTYDVYFDTNPSPSTLICDDTSATSCDLPSLNPNTQYYWQVIATDEHQASTEGPVWDFTTENAGFTVTFTVVDNEDPDNKLQGIEIIFDGNSYFTDANGIVVINDVASGNYDYVIRDEDTGLVGDWYDYNSSAPDVDHLLPVDMDLDLVVPMIDSSVDLNELHLYFDTWLNSPVENSRVFQAYPIEVDYNREDTTQDNIDLLEESFGRWETVVGFNLGEEFTGANAMGIYIFPNKVIKDFDEFMEKTEWRQVNLYTKKSKNSKKPKMMLDKKKLPKLHLIKVYEDTMQGVPIWMPKGTKMNSRIKTQLSQLVDSQRANNREIYELNDDWMAYRTLGAQINWGTIWSTSYTHENGWLIYSSTTVDEDHFDWGNVVDHEMGRLWGISGEASRDDLVMYNPAPPIYVTSEDGQLLRNGINHTHIVMTGGTAT
ncbi:hypothetical protein JW979_05500, partial [bacterium]|nr:hypothetical protein [candidate division CSSED10-310 bacterium]